MYNPTPSQIAASLDATSSARLSSYMNFFRPASQEELYGIYCWNEVLSSNFMRLTGLVEVALRNRLHLVMSRYAKANFPAQVTGSADSNDWYSVLLPVGSKSLDKVKDITHDKSWNRATRSKVHTPKTIPVSPNTVVSSMTLGFWAPLMDLSLPWDTLMPQIIPNHKYASNAAYWKNQQHVGRIYARLETLRSLRNRVAHFEPLWKLPDILEEKKQTRGIVLSVEHAAPTTEAEVFQRLNMLYQRATQMLFWISSERAQDQQRAEFHQKTLFLMSAEGLECFKRCHTHDSVRLSSLTKSWGMKLIMKDRKPIQIEHEKKVIGYFYPSP